MTEKGIALPFALMCLILMGYYTAEFFRDHHSAQKVKTKLSSFPKAENFGALVSSWSLADLKLKPTELACSNIQQLAQGKYSRRKCLKLPLLAEPSHSLVSSLKASELTIQCDSGKRLLYVSGETEIDILRIERCAFSLISRGKIELGAVYINSSSSLKLISILETVSVHGAETGSQITVESKKGWQLATEIERLELENSELALHIQGLKPGATQQ